MLARIGGRGRGISLSVPHAPKSYTLLRKTAFPFIPHCSVLFIGSTGEVEWGGKSKHQTAGGAKNPSLPADLRGQTCSCHGLGKPDLTFLQEELFPRGRGVGGCFSGGGGCFSGWGLPRSSCKLASSRCPPGHAVLSQARSRFKPGPCLPSPETPSLGQERDSQKLAASPGKPSEQCSRCK